MADRTIPDTADESKAAAPREIFAWSAATAFPEHEWAEGTWVAKPPRGGQEPARYVRGDVADELLAEMEADVLRKLVKAYDKASSGAAFAVGAEPAVAAARAILARIDGAPDA